MERVHCKHAHEPVRPIPFAACMFGGILVSTGMAKLFCHIGHKLYHGSAAKDVIEFNETFPIISVGFSVIITASASSS